MPAPGEKPYKVYRGGRTKGKVPLARRDEAKQQTVRQFGQRIVQNDDELQSLIKSAHDDYLKLNKPDAPLTVDAMAAVPWSDVIDVVNIGKREKIDKIEFAMGAAAPK